MVLVERQRLGIVIHLIFNKTLNRGALEGFIVATKGYGCQKDIATKILEKECGHVLALKENQKTLYNDVKLRLNECGIDGVYGLKTRKNCFRCCN